MESTAVAVETTTPGKKAPEPPSIGRGTLVGFVISLMLVVVAALVTYINSLPGYAGQLSLWVFVAALAALVPLAWLIGEIAEVLCDFLSPLFNGLISAFLGNVPELAIGGFLLAQARTMTGTVNIDVIRGLLIGSVINNVLLTLGVATLVGAVKHGKMTFKKEQAAGYASMLALAVVGLAVPTLAASFADNRRDPAAFNLAIDQVSIIVGIILFVTYVLYVLHSVFHFWDSKKKPEESEQEAGATREAQPVRHADERAQAEVQQDDDDADKARHMSNRRVYRGTYIVALVLLAVTTVCTVGMAGVVVHVTQPVILKTGLTPLSTGLIIFPIVCNLGEASSAIFSALRGDMESVMSVAAGSSIQIPLFVTPILVFLSFFMAQGNVSDTLTLIFKPLELIIVALVTFVYALVNLDGETTWLEGIQLLAFFVMIAVTAFALPGA